MSRPGPSQRVEIGAFLANEVWMPIPDYPGYEASSLGRVRSFLIAGGKGGTTDAPRVLATLNRGGYRAVNLRKDGRSRTVNVNVLVLTAFKGPRPPGHVSRHLDGTRDNNALSNLAWGTPSENAADADLHGAMPKGERHWSRTKPERIRTGDRHWRASDPETLRRKAAVQELAAQGLRYAEIGRRLGIGGSHARDLLLGRSRRGKKGVAA